MIKVMIVDDSALIRRILTDILNKDQEISVIATARNGKEALEKLEEVKPDLVTLDIEMPIMDGLTTLKHIVAKYDIPVIMISSLSQEGAEHTLEALDEGAIDFLPKPNNVLKLSEKDISEQILNKIKSAAQAKNLYGRSKLPNVKAFKKSKHIKARKSFSSIIAIASSTGGPRALQNVLSAIPRNINATIVIAQHMPAKFTKSLADRLNSISEINVKEAEEGDILELGCAYIAPGDYHMKILNENSKLVVRLNQEAKVMGLRPTADYLMQSISIIEGYSKLGVVLTGMGSDGAKGIEALKMANAYTIAQDEKTSVVYGMPRAAISTGYIDEIISIEDIADKITNKVGV